MKTFKQRHLLFSLIILLILNICLTLTFAAQKEVLFYAIEINGVLCGYKELNLNHTVKDGRNILLLEYKTKIKFSVEGTGFDLGMDSTFELEPKTGNFLIHENEINMKNSTIDVRMVKEDDTILISSKSDEETAVVSLPPEVILDNFYYYPFLINDFIKKGEEEKSYEVFNVTNGEINKITYTKKGMEDLEFLGKIYQTIVLDELNQNTGLKKTKWIDINNYLAVKTIIQDRVEYLAHPSVVSEMSRANLDESLFVKVNTPIKDFLFLSYLKVKAVIEVTGELVTSDSLNVPGQKFTGTVENNIIDGFFEIQHTRYNGDNAPPFTPDFSENASLKKYLEPGNFIESDDPVLIRQAQEISRGSKDSWEAALRVSRWVAENIHGDILGGISARDVFNTNKGDCGGYSLLLVAFCRAIDIPARLVTGCAYSRYLGGSFGQHVWVELYMGAAGWVAVDATFHEIDHIDSGHIRLGNKTNFYPKKMEIIEYRITP